MNSILAHFSRRDKMHKSIFDSTYSCMKRGFKHTVKWDYICESRVFEKRRNEKSYFHVSLSLKILWSTIFIPMQCRDRKSTLLDQSTQLIGRLYPVSKRKTEAELKERSLLLCFYIQFGVYFDVGIIQSCYRLIWFSRDTRLKVVKIVATSCLSYCVILIPGKYNFQKFGVYIDILIIKSCYRWNHHWFMYNC